MFWLLATFHAACALSLQTRAVARSAVLGRRHIGPPLFHSVIGLIELQDQRLKCKRGGCAFWKNVGSRRRGNGPLGPSSRTADESEPRLGAGRLTVFLVPGFFWTAASKQRAAERGSNGVYDWTVRAAPERPTGGEVLSCCCPVVLRTNLPLVRAVSSHAWWRAGPVFAEAASINPRGLFLAATSATPPQDRGRKVWISACTRRATG